MTWECCHIIPVPFTKCPTAVGHNGWPGFHLNTPLQALRRGFLIWLEIKLHWIVGRFWNIMPCVTGGRVPRVPLECCRRYICHLPAGSPAGLGQHCMCVCFNLNTPFQAHKRGPQNRLEPKTSTDFGCFWNIMS